MASEEKNFADVPVIYSNHARLGLAFSDFRIFFGENIPNPPTTALADGEMSQAPSIQTIDRVCIVLTPDTVPQLIDGLAKAVKLYETNFGPLRKPAQLQLNPQIPQATQQ